MDKKIKDTLAQASYWAYAAWTFPFVALALVIGETLIGHETWMGAMAIAVVVTFVITSVFWWWWALSKIVFMIKATQQVEENFNELKSELTRLSIDINQAKNKNK